MAEIITDAELVNKFAKQVMKEPEADIVTRAPSSNEVELPGGLIEPNGEVLKTAEVQELTGADEEAIAKSGSTGKALNVLLQRGVLKIGSRDVRKDDLDNLLSGDRDAILLGIRRVTFGEQLKVYAKCYACATEQETEISLLNDIPVKNLEDPVADRVFEVETKKGVVRVSLPTGATQKRLMENNDKTSAEINTLLLAGCILSVGGTPSMGAATALSLGMADRTKILEELVDRNPGPRLGEVTKACTACGESMELPLRLLDLFRL